MVETRALFILGDTAEDEGRFEAARANFTRGSELGCTLCMTRLAYLYDTGAGGATDKAQAMRLYRRAWRLKQCLDAGNNIGIIYRERGDHRGRVRWLKKLVALNHGDAHFELAKCYLAGTGVRKNVQAALRHLSVALQLDEFYNDDREEAESILEAMRPQQVR